MGNVLPHRRHAYGMANGVTVGLKQKRKKIKAVRSSLQHDYNNYFFLNKLKNI